MAWGATVVQIDMKGYTVQLHFAEDTTGETEDETVPIPKAPEPNWLPEYVGNRIVDLSKRTAVIQSIVVGYVTASPDVLQAANVTAAPDPATIVAEPPILAPPAQPAQQVAPQS